MIKDAAVVIPENCIKLVHQALDLGIFEQELGPAWDRIECEDVRKKLTYHLFTIAQDANYQYLKDGKVYKVEGILDGKLIRASYGEHMFCNKRFRENPEFFEIDYMKGMDMQRFRKFFTDDNGNFFFEPQRKELTERRVFLWRNIAEELERTFGSDPMNLIAQPYIEIITKKLKRFAAYSDPLEKKSHLLCGILEQEKILSPLDPENKKVSIDYIVMKFSLRYPLVEITNSVLKNKLINGYELTEEEGETLRFAVDEAINRIGKEEALKLNPNVDMHSLDRGLWGTGLYCKDEKARIKCDECCFNPKCEKVTDYKTPLTLYTLDF